MSDFKQMTPTELKQYLSDHRLDDAQFTQALSELLSRDPNPTIYPADLPVDEVERIISAKIAEVRSQP